VFRCELDALDLTRRRPLPDRRVEILKIIKLLPASRSDVHGRPGSKRLLSTRPLKKSLPPAATRSARNRDAHTAVLRASARSSKEICCRETGLAIGARTFQWSPTISRLPRAGGLAEFMCRERETTARSRLATATVFELRPPPRPVSAAERAGFSLISDQRLGRAGMRPRRSSISRSETNDATPTIRSSRTRTAPRSCRSRSTLPRQYVRRRAPRRSEAGTGAACRYALANHGFRCCRSTSARPAPLWVHHDRLVRQADHVLAASSHVCAHPAPGQIRGRSAIGPTLRKRARSVAASPRPSHPCCTPGRGRRCPHRQGGARLAIHAIRSSAPPTSASSLPDLAHSDSELAQLREPLRLVQRASVVCGTPSYALRWNAQGHAVEINQ
jgi:hypothetical protein